MTRKPLIELTDAQISRAADRHDSLAEDYDALDYDDMEVAAAYHATRAAELRLYVEKRRAATPTPQDSATPDRERAASLAASDDRLIDLIAKHCVPAEYKSMARGWARTAVNEWRASAGEAQS